MIQTLHNFYELHRFDYDTDNGYDSCYIGLIMIQFSKPQFQLHRFDYDTKSSWQ